MDSPGPKYPPAEIPRGIAQLIEGTHALAHFRTCSAAIERMRKMTTRASTLLVATLLAAATPAVALCHLPNWARGP